MQATRLRIAAPMALWAIDLRLDPGTAALAMFDVAERDRHDRFRFPADRRRYRAAHFALRSLLAQASGITVAAQRFTAGAFGKPVLIARPDLGFSLSYAGNAAVIAIADARQVGVDIEQQRPIESIESLAADIFTVDERTSLMAHAGTARDAAFLRCWTRKEACVKASGAGLSASLDFDAGTGTAPASVTVRRDAHRCRVEVGSFSVGTALVGAWAHVA